MWLHVKSKLSLSSQRARTLSAEQADRRERTDVIINHTLSLAQLLGSTGEQSITGQLPVQTVFVFLRDVISATSTPT